MSLKSVDSQNFFVETLYLKYSGFLFFLRIHPIYCSLEQVNLPPFIWRFFTINQILFLDPFFIENVVILKANIN